PPKLRQNPPTAAPGFAWLENGEPLATPEGVRGAGHRFDRDAAPPAGHLRDRVRGKDHQELVDQLHPERDVRVATRSLEMNSDEPVAIGNEVGERRVHA